jgi:hypothetical protein
MEVLGLDSEYQYSGIDTVHLNKVVTVTRGLEKEK